MKQDQKARQAIFFIPLITVLFYWMWRAYALPSHDFSNAYVAAFFLQNGWMDNSIYDALSFNQAALDKGFSELFLAYYPNTPFLAFFFYPFSFLALSTAKLLFNGGSILLFLIALMRLQKQLKTANWLFLLIPVLFFNSLRNGLYFGQVYFLLLFLLVMGEVAYSKDNYWRGAAYWGVGLLLKVFPVLLGLLLLIKASYRGLVAYILLAIGGVLCSLLLLDLGDWLYYWSEVLPQSTAGNYYNGFAVAAQSATMLFKHAFVYDAVLNPQPLFISYPIYLFAEAIYKAGILGIAIWFSWKKKESLLIGMGAWIIACNLLSPGLSSYAGILLIFPWMVVWQKDNSIPWVHQWLFTFFVLLYVNLPAHYFYELPVLLKFPKLYLLLFLFGHYVYLLKGKNSLDKKLLRVVVTLFTVLMALAYFKEEPLKNNYAMDKEEHILMINYGVQNGALVYDYWTIPSSKRLQTQISITSVDSTVVTIRNKQVFYKNKQLTTDKSNKRKPLFVNGEEVYYLSDRNRGIGFYTLMKVKVN